MKRKTILRNVLLYITCISMLYSCKQRDDYPSFDDKEIVTPPTDIIPEDKEIEPVTKQLMAQTDLIKTFLVDSSVTLTNGLVRTHIRYQNKLDQRVSLQLLTVDLSSKAVFPSIMSAFDDYLYVSQPIGDMAKYCEPRAGGEILAATNAALSSTYSYIKNGRQINVSTSNIKTKEKTRPFFAIHKDGTPYIGNCADTTKFAFEPYDLNQFSGLVSGTNWVRYRGYNVLTTAAIVQAITAIGLSTDKKTMYALVVDGGDTNFSVGISLNDVAVLMGALGSYDAFVLNGGSTSVMVQKTNTGNQFNPVVWNTVSKPLTAGGSASISGIAFVKR
ncbi:phosphodiester glycosidase family protein [Sphingobacterium multivorum]|uniref:phosphodiester glycosidase family protein n=1 Tax=Sphingobacterium multivorum TaxID=28454 RepID=UPI0028B0F510|nr:phosphodiester glycosidase family protein [Sphingobacterium multivorum]